MAKGRLVWPRFGSVSPELQKAAKTIEITTKDGKMAEVDDDMNWYADDDKVFDVVVPVAEKFPGALSYYPLPLQRAYDAAKYVAGEIGGKVVTKEPEYSPDDYKSPRGRSPS